MQGPLQFDLHTVDSIKSTNTALKSLAKSGAAEGYVLSANMQTNGRGRYNRVFFSPEESGLYVSVLLRPTVVLAPSALTCMSAVAVSNTIESFGISCAIKWVNDIYVEGRKAVGILTEGSIRYDGLYDFAVVGIGVNLFPPKNGFPESIRETAGSVFSGNPDASIRSEFLTRLLQNLKRNYEVLPDMPFFEEYRKKQMIYGSSVLFSEGIRTLRGLASDIDRDFRLVVTCSDGSVHRLDRGEVTILS